MDKNWLPEYGRGIRLWLETKDGLPKLPSGSPSPLVPQQMKSVGKIKKGLDGFIAHWSKMVNFKDSADFRHLNGLAKEYWKGVRAALDEPLVVHDTLEDEFWLASRITNELEDQMQEDGILLEEFV